MRDEIKKSRTINVLRSNPPGYVSGNLQGYINSVFGFEVADGVKTMDSLTRSTEESTSLGEKDGNVSSGDYLTLASKKTADLMKNDCAWMLEVDLERLRNSLHFDCFNVIFVDVNLWILHK
ncbi:predicted protein [Sclerotinia sclerotiorum 1980 UF-70]|uniref:Uncharacterized protein n=1 Tax=Sclerotinia sclerotiorum (strain ATCC 18683 / 1980 / Ss-1) TaxID=665079 RepID=A7EWQ2_SCLS1|nr:predicted protein [Sclerotinia sclerotiorum 1980 UF-70]EDN93894.1 predicted protein [Sclerotinia sclerotiorum 1980 UF-70]